MMPGASRTWRTRWVPADRRTKPRPDWGSLVLRIGSNEYARPRTGSSRGSVASLSTVDDSVYFAVDSIVMSTTIRVSERTRDRLARLSRLTGRPMTQLLDEAADALERRIFFDELDVRFGALRADRAAWAAIEAERASESAALRDHSQ